MPKKAKIPDWPSWGSAVPATPAAAVPQASATETELHLLMEAIYRQYSYDFRDYAGASQKRRVLQALAQFDCPTISALQAGMLHDPACSCGCCST